MNRSADGGESPPRGCDRAGEADADLATIVEDAANGQLREIYKPPRPRLERKSSRRWQDYPRIPWDTIDLQQFDLIGQYARHGSAWHIQRAGLTLEKPLRCSDGIRAAVVLTVATSARSPDSLAIPFASAPMRVWSTKCFG